MKRGDVVLVREPASPAAKPRPCVIVQRDSAVSVAAKITVCPLTSQLRGAAGQRPSVAPTPENRLQVASEVQVDWIFTHPVERVGAVIGALDVPTMDQVDHALRRWLGL